MSSIRADISIVGNVGDDTEVLGLHISPDLDSVLYTLTGLADEERGWGRADETWNALDTVTRLGGESWFRLGDRDIGLHLVRTQLLREGVSMSEATERIAHALGLEAALLPATDDPLRTFLETPAGTFPFQTWFVARGHKDEVDAVHYAGAPEARAAPGVLDAIRARRRDPDRAEQPVRLDRPDPRGRRDPQRRSSSERCRVSRSARSSDGRAVKGPADRMLSRLAGGTTPEHVAGCYEGLIDVARRRRDRRAERACAWSAQHGRHADADDGCERGAASRRRNGACGGHAGVRIAILGGTGSFGRALAGRLVALAQDDVVIGSRDAERARLAADELGGGRISGATNVDAVRGADLVVLAVKADAALDTASEVAEALDVTPLLCVASAIEFRKGVGALPGPRGAQPRRARAGHGARARSRRACIRSPRPTSTRRHPTRTR